MAGWCLAQEVSCHMLRAATLVPALLWNWDLRLSRRLAKTRTAGWFPSVLVDT